MEVTFGCDLCASGFSEQCSSGPYVTTNRFTLWIPPTRKLVVCIYRAESEDLCPARNREARRAGISRKLSTPRERKERSLTCRKERARHWVSRRQRFRGESAEHRVKNFWWSYGLKINSFS